MFNRGWVKNQLIGMFEFDLSTIYFAEGNKMEHGWVALNNQDAEDFSEIKGLLKLSLSVTGPKDNAVKLADQTGPEPPEMKMLMYAMAKREYYQLTIRLIEGRDLPTFGGVFGLGGESLECYVKC